MLLHLETATAVCSAALSHNGAVIATRESAEPRAHAAMLTVFIDELLTEAGITAYDVDAVSLSAGPGSYTGLRIASSAAKGFCYAANKPLIALNTLQLMASGFLQDNAVEGGFLICPMIDARRDEVFSAIYNSKLDVVQPPAPELLTVDSYTAQVAQEFFALAAEGGEFFFGHGLELRLFLDVFEILQTLHALANGGHVGEHTTEPAVIDVVLVGGFRRLTHGFLSLALATDEENLFVLAGKTGEEIRGFVEALDGFVEVDDVDPALILEEIRLHFGIPLFRLVTVVNACVHHF